MNRRFSKFTLGFAGVVGLLGFVPEANAQAWTQAYNSPTDSGDCGPLPASIATDTSQFAIVPIINRVLFTDPQPARITKLAFWLNPVTHKADIFVGERGSSISSTAANRSMARISYYNASATPSPTLTVIGSFENKAYIGFSESGVFGLAVNPQTFGQDNFLYVLYASGSAATKSETNGWRVSRFKLHPTTRMMDMNSEKILLHIPAGTANRWHTATSLRFDNFGNLYIGSADNEATSNGPANTADLRGGILRIKPDSTNPRGYTIPAGNFGDYWASQWQARGLTTRAAAYRDTAAVKPEIYVKGSRNPYSFGVDPNRLGWLAWSECGPDQQRGEEHNFTTKPAFSGWPFWAAMGVRQASYASSYDEAGPGTDTAAYLEPKSAIQWGNFNPTTMDTALPINNWRLSAGVDTLPPMHRPYSTQTSGCAMGGPIIRYDGRIRNPDKLPPHLDNVILTSNTTTWYAAKIDTTNATVGTAQTVFTMPKSSTTTTFSNSSETVQGPDGVLYAVDQTENCCGTRDLNNREGVVKVVYKGTCRDPGLKPVAITPGKSLAHTRSAEWLRVGGTSFSITVPGMHEAVILDMAGRTVHSFRGEGHKTYNLPTVGAGIHVLRVKTTAGIVSSPLAAGL